MQLPQLKFIINLYTLVFPKLYDLSKLQNQCLFSLLHRGNFIKNDRS